MLLHDSSLYTGFETGQLGSKGEFHLDPKKAKKAFLIGSFQGMRAGEDLSKSTLCIINPL